MRILTVENSCFELNDIPEEVDDLRYGILDYSNPKHVDYYFIPLMFLESFYSPAAVLRIGEYTVHVPLDWSIVLCDSMIGEPEVVSLMSMNDRGFTTFVTNPITAFAPRYEAVSIENIYTDVKWYAPKMKFGHLLCVPLTEGENPPCALFVKEANKIPEVLDINELL